MPAIHIFSCQACNYAIVYHSGIHSCTPMPKVDKIDHKLLENFFQFHPQSTVKEFLREHTSNVMATATTKEEIHARILPYLNVDKLEQIRKSILKGSFGKWKAGTGALRQLMNQYSQLH